MAFGNFNGDDDDMPMAEINVTPLVDVMLVLLIVFMITMPVLTHTVRLQLPNAREEETLKPPPEENKILRLSIDEQGGYSLNNRNCTLDEMGEAFRDARRTNPDTVLAVAADKNVPYEKVALALEKAQAADIAKIGFHLEAP